MSTNPAKELTFADFQSLKNPLQPTIEKLQAKLENAKETIADLNRDVIYLKEVLAQARLETIVAQNTVFENIKTAAAASEDLRKTIINDSEKEKTKLTDELQKMRQELFDANARADDLAAVKNVIQADLNDAKAELEEFKTALQVRLPAMLEAKAKELLKVQNSDLK
jgi:chromosome segregation ATPase